MSHPNPGRALLFVSPGMSNDVGDAGPSGPSKARARAARRRASRRCLAALTASTVREEHVAGPDSMYPHWRAAVEALGAGATSAAGVRNAALRRQSASTSMLSASSAQDDAPPSSPLASSPSSPPRRRRHPSCSPASARSRARTHSPQRDCRAAACPRKRGALCATIWRERRESQIEKSARKRSERTKKERRLTRKKSERARRGGRRAKPFDNPPHRLAAGIGCGT